MNHRSMRSASSASETTPSRSGRTARIVPGRPAEHLLGPRAGGDEPAGADLDGDDRRLLEHDTPATHVDQRVGGAEVDREVAPERRHVVMARIVSRPSARARAHRASVAHCVTGVTGVTIRAGRGGARQGRPEAPRRSARRQRGQSSGNQMPISRSPDSCESEPCTMFCCTWVPQSRPKSPRIVPGSASVGLVAPASDAEALDAVLALDDDGGDRARAHEVDERLVERLAHVLGVVHGELLTGRRQDREGARV